MNHPPTESTQLAEDTKNPLVVNHSIYKNTRIKKKKNLYHGPKHQRSSRIANRLASILNWVGSPVDLTKPHCHLSPGEPRLPPPPGSRSPRARVFGRPNPRQLSWTGGHYRNYSRFPKRPGNEIKNLEYHTFREHSFSRQLSLNNIICVATAYVDTSLIRQTIQTHKQKWGGGFPTAPRTWQEGSGTSHFHT